MIQTHNIHSLTNFQKQTAFHLRRLRASGLPEVLTVKGRAELIIQTADGYQALLSKLELYESAIAVSRGFQDVAGGKYTSLKEMERLMRAKYPALRARP